MLMKAKLLLLASVASQLRPGDTSSPLSLLLDLKDRIFSDTQTTGLDQENLGNNSVAEPLFNETEYENSTIDSKAVQGTRSDLEIQATDGNRLVEINEQDSLHRTSAFLNNTNPNDSQYEYGNEQELNYTNHQEINYGKKNIGNSENEDTEDTNIQREQATNTTFLSDIIIDSLSLATKNNTITIKPKDSNDTRNVFSIEQNNQLDKMSGNESRDDLTEFVNAEITEATNNQSNVHNMTEICANNVTERFFLNATDLNVPNVTVAGQIVSYQSGLCNTSFESEKLQTSNETKESTITSSSNGSGNNGTVLNEKPTPDNNSKVSNQTAKNKSNLSNLVNVLSNSTQIVERYIENITESLATLDPEIESILSTGNVEGITKALTESVTTFPNQTLNTSTTAQSARNETHTNSQVEVNTDQNLTLGNVLSEFMKRMDNGSNNDRIKRNINLTFSWDEESETENSVNTVFATSKDLLFKASLNLTDRLDTTGWNDTTNRTDYVCNAHDDEVVLQADLNTTSNPTLESDVVATPAVTQDHLLLQQNKEE